MNGFLSGLNSSAIKKLRATHMFVPPESLQVIIILMHNNALLLNCFFRPWIILRI